MSNSTEAKKDYQSEQELVDLEGQLPRTTYTFEKSDLMKVNSNFPRIRGLSFIAWLNHYSNGGRVLEIGGGKEQSAAREVVRKYPEVFFYALEPRPLNEDVKQELAKASRFHLSKRGISQIGLTFPDQRFNIIFAHHVLEHVPNPLISIKDACNLLEPGGVFFCNGIPMSVGVPERVVGVLRRQGLVVDYDGAFYKTEGPLVKAGNIRASFAIQVVDNFDFPSIVEGEYLTDCFGRRLVRHCYVKENGEEIKCLRKN